MKKWQIDIWQYHNVVDSYENNNIEEVLKWFRQNWLWSYDNGNCSFDVYKNDRLLTFDEENELGFFEDDYGKEE